MAINLQTEDQHKAVQEGKKLQNNGVSMLSEAKLDRPLTPASTPSPQISVSNKGQSQAGLGS